MYFQFNSLCLALWFSMAHSLSNWEFQSLLLLFCHNVLFIVYLYFCWFSPFLLHHYYTDEMCRWNHLCGNEIFVSMLLHEWQLLNQKICCMKFLQSRKKKHSQRKNINRSSFYWRDFAILAFTVSIFFHFAFHFDQFFEWSCLWSECTDSIATIYHEQNFAAKHKMIAF